MSIFQDIIDSLMGTGGGAVPATPNSGNVAAQAGAGAGPQAGAVGATNQPATQAMAYAGRRGSNHAPTATCATCGLQSVRFHLGWTFHPNDVPQGTVQLRPGMPAAEPIPANGEIVLDQAAGRGIPQGTRSARLEVNITNGPTYQFDVFFDLPPIHEPAGLKRRLTNLGLYAGIDEYFGGRALWAIRAFKRIHINSYTRNATETEDDNVDGTTALTLSNALLAAVQTAHGAHPDDVTAALAVPENLINRQRTAIANAGMFMGLPLRRSSYEAVGATDDKDPVPGSTNAVWGGTANPTATASTPGYEICLGVYDETQGEPPIANRINLPQPVHMLQFALFETGHWVVAGGRANGQTITRFGPAATVGATNAAGGIFASMDGDFGRSTHWGLREFQCSAKLPQAAVEDVTVTEPLYLQRLITLDPSTLFGEAQYGGDVTGTLNADTARAVQDWLDRRYRCPVVIYAAPSRDYLNPATIRENIWRYNDWNTTALRMYAIDRSGAFTIPAVYSGQVMLGGQAISQPVTVGDYSPYTQNARVYGGPRTVGNHIWELDTTEVTPQTTYGTGGYTGAGLTAAQLSTFKVIRAAAHFECLGHYDALNAYDRVTLSFGLCHWTLAVIGHAQATPPPVNQAREMGGLFSFLESQHAATYENTIGRFGLSAQTSWPIAASNGAYTSSVTMPTETGTVLLAGASFATGNNQSGVEDNRYGHTWSVYYRMLMANRTNADLQQALAVFARKRIENILNATVGTGTVADYLTSEKAIAMAYRCHIYTTGFLRNLRRRLATVGASNPIHNQAREELAMDAVEAAAAANAAAHAREIRGWTNLPQNRGLIGVQYNLNLDDPSISGTVNSFDFDAP